MERVLILILLIVAVVSCRPKGVINQRKMVTLLTELHRADGAMQVTNLTYGRDADMERYYADVLARNGVTQAEFDSSLVWYTHHPQRFDKIYPRVIANLQKEMDMLDQGIIANRNLLEDCYYYMRVHPLDSVWNPLSSAPNINRWLPIDSVQIDSLGQDSLRIDSVGKDSMQRIEKFPFETKDSVKKHAIRLHNLGCKPYINSVW